MSRPFRPLRFLIVLTALSGCASHQRVSSAEVTPRTEVRVRFDTPRSVILAAPDAGELPLREVTEIHGRVISATADSLRMAVSSARLGGEVTQRLGAGTTTTIAVAGAHFERVQRHTGRTLALVGVLVLGAALLIAVATYQEPPPPPPPEPKPK
ncbi:MAG TPA: hypothetical protein VFO66_10260 [Gemmatimonadaceae bacterium]|nr:hypothetical protein [Gemmatimonadaceae bacterium]